MSTQIRQDGICETKAIQIELQAYIREVLLLSGRLKQW